VTAKFVCPHCGERILLPESRLSRRRLVVIFAALGLVVGAMLFPPYGYSDYTRRTIVKNRPDIPPSSSQNHRAWRFVGYRFILSPPPQTDYDWREMMGDAGAGVNIMWVNEITNMAVGWHIVAIEIASVLALTSAALFLRPARRFIFQRKAMAAQPVK
jgi:hypothetical protein